MNDFLLAEGIAIALQLLLFSPFFYIYMKDCKEYGKERLAISLGERFFVWIMFFPMWLMPILHFFEINA